MDARTALQRCASAGLRLQLAGADLRVRYQAEPSAEQWRWLQTHKAELIGALRDTASADSDVKAPIAPLSALEEASIRDWLVLIGEDDPESIAEVIANCRRDSAARSYFTDRAASALGLTLDRFTGTDRRQCSDCRQLGPGGRCRAAARGQLVQTARRHHPDPAQPRRCIAYRPSASDPDQRPGYERWPHLTGTAPARQAAA